MSECSAHERPEEGSRHLGPGVMDACKPPKMGAGNQAGVLARAASTHNH